MRRPLILLVNSSRDTRDIYRTMLEWHGYGVVEAADTESGMEAARTLLPDVVIGDFPLTLPGDTSFITALRATPRLENVRVLSVTSRAMSHEVVHAEDVSDAVLLKPVLPARVVDEVERLVGPPLEPPLAP